MRSTLTTKRLGCLLMCRYTANTAVFVLQSLRAFWVEWTFVVSNKDCKHACTCVYFYLQNLFSKSKENVLHINPQHEAQLADYISPSQCTLLLEHRTSPDIGDLRGDSCKERGRASICRTDCNQNRQLQNAVCQCVYVLQPYIPTYWIL